MFLKDISSTFRGSISVQLPPPKSHQLRRLILTRCKVCIINKIGGLLNRDVELNAILLKMTRVYRVGVNRTNEEKFP